MSIAEGFGPGLLTRRGGCGGNPSSGRILPCPRGLTASSTPVFPAQDNDIIKQHAYHSPILHVFLTVNGAAVSISDLHLLSGLIALRVKASAQLQASNHLLGTC